MKRDKPQKQSQNVPKKPKKNQAVLDFLQSVKDALKDTNPKDFGLYMKLFKQHGKDRINTALFITQKKNLPDENKLRYFLAILMNKRTKKEDVRSAYKKLKEERKKTKGGAVYEKLKSALAKKMTPPYQRRSRTRTQILHKIAKQERKPRGIKP